MSHVQRPPDGISFRCPGCGDIHAIPTTGPRAWGWNGLLSKPTITPSILVKSGHYADSHKPGDSCWCGTDYGSGFTCYRCHSFVTDGRIIFCPDSTHALSGQTVDLPDVDP